MKTFCVDRIDSSYVQSAPSVFLFAVVLATSSVQGAVVHLIPPATARCGEEGSPSCPAGTTTQKPTVIAFLTLYSSAAVVLNEVRQHEVPTRGKKKKTKRVCGPSRRGDGQSTGFYTATELTRSNICNAGASVTTSFSLTHRICTTGCSSRLAGVPGGASLTSVRAAEHHAR